MDETANEPTTQGNQIPSRHRGHAHHSSRRHGEYNSHGSQRRVSQRLMLAVALGISLLLLLSISIFSVVRINTLSEQNDALNSDLFKAKQELSATLPELEHTRKELAGLIKGRLPQLRELVPDKVMKVNADYVKNIVFTVLNQNGHKHYEYRLVIENTSEYMVHPDARILVFDRRGVQVGMSEVKDRIDIAPGESRAYSATVERFMDGDPFYFFVSTRSAQ
jgi:hypothetical protein